MKKITLTRNGQLTANNREVSDLKKGLITREDAIKELSDLAKRAARDEDLFSAERFDFYDSSSDGAVLARLLSGAVSNLQERVQR